MGYIRLERYGRIFKKCTMNNCESEEIVGAANIAISNLLPTKSRSLYDIAYNRFKKWCAEKNVQVYCEHVLLAYFIENAKNYKSSTLCAQYSMPVGKNTMGKIPSVVASYLKLPDVACYTGHCLRRSSATLLADAGVDITTIKRLLVGR
ncbi:hypothetical protein NQ317_016435 [Molorchus minor]|uniref:Tyr recombinase domain-containing protein n=1 Tax=Molorchus minor TaxID=1323400 RepID=A0ABQ9K020_9CUCU|nr:hypothetical protein NQ317_016435 [Molorchus minor]